MENARAVSDPSPNAAAKVTFVVPCYKLAHLLAECVNSILEQTHTNLEILIMDDASPDNTPEVAASFGDPRVRHIRNDPNLGHLRNYNKGIALASGKYVWLISADDRLRKPYIVERYVAAMEANPRIGYAICPGMALVDGQETRLLEYSYLGPDDKTLDGRQFLKSMLRINHVLAAAGMVRKSVYEDLGAFPLDLPFAGDWYLWCLFALHYDVAYFAEPMVNYREHAGAMTNILIDEDIRILPAENLEVRWRLRDHVEKAGAKDLLPHCDAALVRGYSYTFVARTYRGVDCPAMTPDELQASLAKYSQDRALRRSLTRQVLTLLADDHYAAHRYGAAARGYWRAIRHDARNLVLWVKLSMICLGDFGYALRRRFGAT